MSSVQAVLRASGIWPDDDEVSAPTIECAGLARSLRDGRARTIGLLPARDDVAVPAVALQLGRALAARSPGPVAVVDARGTWPCAPALADGAIDPEQDLPATSWVLDGLAVLTPHPPAAGAALDQLRRVVAPGAAPFEHLVVDLTGFDRLGEELPACELLDVVLLVARSGRTTRREIQGWLRGLPEHTLGVLLTGV